MKKLVILCIFIQLTFINISSYADDIETQEIVVDEIKDEAIQTIANSTDEPKINSKSAIVINRDTNTILYEKNSKEKRAMASTTKIMTT